MPRKKKTFNPIPYFISKMKLYWFWYCPERKKALEDSKVAKTRPAKYLCGHCRKAYIKKEINVHHIKDIGRFEDYNSYIERLFCTHKDLAILCKECHKLVHKKGKKIWKIDVKYVD